MLGLHKNAVVIVGGGVLALGALYLLTRPGAGQAAGRAIGNTLGGAAQGLVYGVGDAAGLPDTSDPIVQLEGRAALVRGDYFEASTKLPALEFLGGIGSRIGTGLYEVFNPEGVEAERRAIGVTAAPSYGPEDLEVPELAPWEMPSPFGQGA